jgi:hypothetical protein
MMLPPLHHLEEDIENLNKNKNSPANEGQWSATPPRTGEVECILDEFYFTVAFCVPVRSCHLYMTFLLFELQ